VIFLDLLLNPNKRKMNNDGYYISSLERKKYDVCSKSDVEDYHKGTRGLGKKHRYITMLY